MMRSKQNKTGLQVLLSAIILGALLLPACASSGPDCASEDVFCVGLVTDSGKISDKSFNQSAWEGVLRAEGNLGAVVQYIETADVRDYAKNISTFADGNYDVIVTVGFNLREETREAATRYPDTKFIGVDQDQFEGRIPNLAGLVFPEDQAGFLVGALAAMMSRSHRVGAVCGTDAIPPVWRLGEGYRAGAAYADNLNNTTTRVIVVYHNDVGFDRTFIDPDWGYSTAQSLMKGGADVIFGCGGITGNGAITAAAEAGMFAIGVDTDQYFTLPEAAPRLLSSALKRIEPGVAELINLAHEDNFPAGNYFGDVGYAPFHEMAHQVPVEMEAILDEINSGLENGTIRTGVPAEKP